MARFKVTFYTERVFWIEADGLGDAVDKALSRARDEAGRENFKITEVRGEDGFTTPLDLTYITEKE